jgi:hypothetical protein
VQIRKMITRCQSALQMASLRASELFVAFASMSGLVLTLIAVLSGVLGAWRYSADPGWTGKFFLSDGLLSHYQLWFAVTIGAQASASILNRWVTNRNADLPALVPQE